jgi:GNAT superfamily N-acetyltransferase
MREHSASVDVHFQEIDFGQIQGAVRRHFASLPSAIDSFLEEHIVNANHYRISLNGGAAGFTSIHGGSLITQFAIDEPYKRYGQAVFSQLRRMERVTSAFVPTCDEFFLAHAVDDYRRLNKQAYFFATPESADISVQEGYELRSADMGEADFIRREAGDLVDDVEGWIEGGKIFNTLRFSEHVGFGFFEQATLYDDVASIGMHTIERFRRQGVGTATIQLLIAECRRRGLRPVAGCWYYNHNSKKTLERAGMYTSTRLLTIEF